jgi:hypothetical protein
MDILLSIALFNVSLLNLQLNPPPPIDFQLVQIEQCESGGKDVTVLDVDGYYSYGYFQFHKSTFNKFGEKYSMLHNDIHSRVQQYEIAKAMLYDGLYSQWYNCSKQLGFLDQDGS